jgi:hypothetical protein
MHGKESFIHAQWRGRAFPAPDSTQHIIHYLLISYIELNIKQTITDVGRN